MAFSHYNLIMPHHEEGFLQRLTVLVLAAVSVPLFEVDNGRFIKYEVRNSEPSKIFPKILKQLPVFLVVKWFDFAIIDVM